MQADHKPTSAEEEGYRFVLPQRSAGGLRSGLLSAILGFLRSRCVVEITPRELRIIEHLGPRHWERSWPLARVTALSAQPMRRNRRPSSNPSESHHWGLQLEDSNGESAWAVVGYPREKLEDLADRLRSAMEEFPAPPPVALRVVADEPATQARAARFVGTGSTGASTEIRYESTDDGLRVHVPASGLWKGSRGLWGMGLMFTAAPLAMWIGFFFKALSGGANAWGPVFILTIFLALGVGLSLCGWNMGRRTATFEVSQEGLTVTRRTISGESSRRFRTDEISDLRVGPSGMSINGVQVMELQVFVGKVKVLGLLSQRTTPECEQIVSALTEALSADRSEVE